VALRGALVGAAAAAAWQACDPLLKRVFDTPYVDAELMGPFVTRGPLEPVVNLLTHTAGGAVFGHLFECYGGRGMRAGVVVAVAENTVLWPGLAVFERNHPKRRDGTWPPLVRSPRVFASATAGHALFGALLGWGLARLPAPAPHA
jgi:hypothetical protein